jgi:hypothetical protein
MRWSLKKLQTKIVFPVISSPQNSFADIAVSLRNSGYLPVKTETNNNSSYIFGLPDSLNIFTAISKFFSINNISDSAVKSKTLEILNALNKAIVNTHEFIDIQNYLSKLHLVEQEDESILIEWIYSSFRFGFVVCKPAEDSYYFFVSKNNDTFVSKSEKIRDNVTKLTSEAVKYIVGNT